MDDKTTNPIPMVTPIQVSTQNESWEQYQKLVLHKLDEHSQSLREIAKDISKLKGDVTMLKVKSGVWGMLGGIIPAAIVLAAQLLN